MSAELVPEKDLGELLAVAQGDTDKAVRTSEELLAEYPDDPRLHFLRGSLLAGSGRAIEAYRSLSRAVELAPGYALARYQLGFFELTSGEPQKALSTWGPLLAEGKDSYLRKFVEGMTHLIRDEFSSAIMSFGKGMELNQDNEPMNRDIQLLIAECRKLLANPATTGADLSATSLMLSQLGGNKTLQ